jgi:hypothetical protein
MTRMLRPTIRVESSAGLTANALPSHEPNEVALGKDADEAITVHETSSRPRWS